MGMALLGTCVGGALIRAITPNLAASFGWRGAVAVMSSGIWLIALPLFLWLVREDDQPDTANERAYVGDFVHGVAQSYFLDAGDRGRAHRIRRSSDGPAFRAVPR